MRLCAIIQENSEGNVVLDKIKGYILSEKGKKLVYYGVSGVITTIISFVSFKLFLDILNLHYVIAFSASWLLAVTFAYLSTRIKVYKSKASNKREKAFEYTRFIIGRVITYVVNLVLLMIAVEWLKLDEFWSNVVITIIVIILNYFIGELMINRFKSKVKIDKGLFDSIKFLSIMLVITVMAVVVRIVFYDVESVDYLNFLSKWFDYLKANGGISAVATLESDYNVPYLEILALLTYLPLEPLYLIKTVSVIFDVLLAVSVMVLVSKLTNKNSKYMLISYAVVLFLPTVILNSAAWAQCDSIYTTFIVLALIKLMDEKHASSIILYGVACAFKLQAIFVLPVYALIFLSKKEMLRKLVYAPLVLLPNIVLSLPAIIYGKSIFSIFGTYGTQVSQYANNISKIYHLIYFNEVPILANKSNVVFVLMIALTLIIFLCALILAQKKKLDVQGKVVDIAFWSVLVSVFFLPCMHDRYLYVAEVLAVVWVIKGKNIEEKVIGVICSGLIWCISLSSYVQFLFGKMGNNMIMSVAIYLGIIVVVTAKVILNGGRNNEKNISCSTNVQ